ncbi:MAG: hypothetical protein QM696_04895 [Steroidobacteraceae bacterium]
MDHSPLQRSAIAGFTVALFWTGLLTGVSFLATPAKFLAPSLSLPVALDVGRQTFAIFNKVEWLLAAGLLLALLSGPRSRIALAAAAAAVAVVVVEALWLLPMLDRRVGMIMAGLPVPPSGLHNLYIGIELAKLAALVVVAVIAGRRIARGPRTG